MVRHLYRYQKQPFNQICINPYPAIELGFLWGEKMTLPTAAELTDPNATNIQMKQRLSQLAENVESKDGAAIKSITAKNEAVSTIVDLSSNLFNDSTSIKENKLISSTGEIVVSAVSTDFAYSDFVTIEPNQNYFYDGFRHIAYYDANKNFISRVDSVRTGSGTYPDPYKYTGALLSPSNAYFIRVNYRTQSITDYTDTNRKINLGSSPIPYEPFYLKLKEGIEVEAAKADATAKADAAEAKANNYTDIKAYEIDVDKLSRSDIVTNSSNLFDYANATRNYTISSTGEVSANTNFAFSDLTAVNPSEFYYFDGFRYIAFYDINMDFISRVDQARTGSGTYPDPYKFYGVIQTPPNCYYVRAIYNQVSSTDPLDGLKINKGSVSLPYEPFYLKLREEVDIRAAIEDNSISKEKLDFLKYSTNLFNHNTVTFGKIILSDGTLSDNSDYAISDFIAVDKNKSYTISSETTYSAFITTAFYDADKNFILRSTTGSSTEPYLISRAYLTLSDVAFVRFNINVTGTGQPNQRNRMFNEGVTALPYEPYYEPRLEGVSVENVDSDTLPVATSTTLGGVIIGSGLTVNDDGVISASATFGQVLGRASGVNLDSETKTLTVSGRVFFQDGTNVLANGTASFDGLIGAPYAVVINRTSGNIRLVRTALYGDILPSEAIIGSFEPYTETLTGFPNGYTLNGIEVGGAVTGNPVIPKIPEIGWDLPGVYNAPPMPGYRPSSAIPMSTVDSFMIQSWFDGLASDHPEYITRTHLGDTATGLPVYAYRFKPDMGGSSVQPRVMIQGAIHAEAMSYVLPFHVMDLIANNWENDPILEAFRWGLDFTVIPVVNPYGVNNNQRHNSNGVDLNRNYPTFWTSGATHGSTFLSELETQYSFQIMKEFKPHIMLDMHYFGTQTSGPTEGAFLWFPGFTQETLRAGQSMINRMARKWKDEHPWMPPASVLDRGTGPISGGSPGAAVDTAIAMGAEAITFETGDRLLGDPSTSSPYSELAIKCGVEAVINYLMILLRR